MDALTPDQVEELRKELVALRRELARDLDSSLEGTRPVELDAPIGRLSRMDALQQQSMAQATRQAAAMRTKLAETALRRMETDEYGLCLECEDGIGYARLKARPEALLCVSCQETRESR